MVTRGVTRFGNDLGDAGLHPLKYMGLAVDRYGNFGMAEPLQDDVPITSSASSEVASVCRGPLACKMGKLTYRVASVKARVIVCELSGVPSGRENTSADRLLRPPCSGPATPPPKPGQGRSGQSSLSWCSSWPQRPTTSIGSCPGSH